MKRRLTIGLGVVALFGAAALIARRDYSKPVVYQEKTVKTWARMAYSGDQNAKEAIRAMGTNALPELTRMLEAKDPWYKRAFWSLQNKLPGRARTTLKQKVGFPEQSSLRGAAAVSLGVIGPQAQSAVPAMAKLLYDPAHQLAYETAAAMSHMGEAAVQPLVKALKHPDPNRRRAFVSALSEIGTNAQSAVPALVELLNDPDENVRFGAGYALQNIGIPGGQGLVEVVRNGKGAARDFAVKELLLYYHKPSSHTTIPAFVEMAQDKDPAARLQAIRALTSMHAMNRPVTAALTNALHDESLEVRLAAITALTPVTWKRDAAMPSLIECLKDSAPRVREAAARSLGEFGPAAKSAVAELNRLLKDEAPSVQAAAKDALVKIQGGP